MLRDILKPNATPKRIEIVLSKIREIEGKINTGQDVNALIKDFNKFTGKQYDIDYFQTYWKAENIEDFARDAAQPSPKKISDITKDELVEIVQRVINADENTHYYLALLAKNLPHPQISDLIFWPENEGLHDNSTAEEIVDKALQYKPIKL